MSNFQFFSKYRPNVRIGNWFEDICLQQEKISKFKHDRANSQLLVDKTRILFDNFHKTVELEKRSNGDLCIDTLVQILPMHMNVCEDASTNTRPSLSIVLNENVVSSCQHINDLCELSVAPMTRPMVRNTFRLVSVEEQTINYSTRPILKYGEHFRLECLNTPEPLYVYSINKSTNLNHIIATTYDSHKFGEINLPLGLVYEKNTGTGKDIPSKATNWFCQHIDPKKRFETYMTPVIGDTPVVITHAITNRNLSAENCKIQTLFGPEFLVSVTNHKNIFCRENWNNIWLIHNG